MDSVTFHFDFGDGTTSKETKVEHQYKKDDLYQVKLIAQNRFCFFEEAIQLPVYTLWVPNVFTPDGSVGLNDYFEIRFKSDQVITPADIGLPVQLTVVDRWGKNVFESQDYKNDWNASGLASGVYYIHLKLGDLTICKNWLQIMK
jgi:hypothetical protein